MSKHVEILNIRINTIKKKSVLEQIKGFLSSSDQSHIATVNPEFLMMAQSNSQFKDVLNRTELNLADGIGLLWAAKYLSLVDSTTSTFKKLFYLEITLDSLLLFPHYCKSIIPERITGIDLMNDICQIAQEENKKVFLLGGSKFNQETPDKIKQVISKKFPQLQFMQYNGPILDDQGNTSDEELQQTLNTINDFKPDILLVAISHPKAQYFIDANLKKLPTVKIAMGVGGAFDFMAGVVPRAPRWMRRLSIEWLFRLIRQPWRFSRVVTATIRFIITVCKSI